MNNEPLTKYELFCLTAQQAIITTHGVGFGAEDTARQAVEFANALCAKIGIEVPDVARSKPGEMN